MDGNPKSKWRCKKNGSVMCQNTLFELSQIFGCCIHSSDKCVARYSHFLVFISHQIANWLSRLKIWVVFDFGLIDAIGGKKCGWSARKHAAGVVVHKCLNALRSSGMTIEQACYIVDISVHNNPILVETGLHIRKSVNGPFTAEQNRNKTENSNEETGHAKDAEANGNFLAPCLLGICVIFLNHPVMNHAGHTTTEVVPPHGPLVGVRLVCRDGASLFGRNRGVCAVVLFGTANCVRQIVLFGPCVIGHFFRKARGWGRNRSHGGRCTRTRVAGIVATFVRNTFFLLVIASRHTRLASHRLTSHAGCC
mmetsp:Transcript_19699/g.37529  ORF Transcript_19699/g.37529 Transcript_19699/m.37529 type:complete len:308 (-) Transcript_19699:982-1905(-)